MVTDQTASAPSSDCENRLDFQPHRVVAYAPDQHRPLLLKEFPNLHEAIRRADELACDPRYGQVQVRFDTAVVYEPPRFDSQTAPKRGSEFRVTNLRSDQPLVDTPNDVLQFSQEFAALSIVELRVCAPPDQDHPAARARPDQLGRGWWVLFYHARPPLAKVSALLARFSADLPDLQHDFTERCVWLRPTIHADHLPAPPPPKRQVLPGQQRTSARAYVKKTAPHPCLCGRCAATTQSNFAMGHDARFYSMLAEFQVTGSTRDFDQLPESTQQALRTWVLPEKKSYLLEKHQK